MAGNSVGTLHAVNENVSSIADETSDLNVFLVNSSHPKTRPVCLYSYEGVCPPHAVSRAPTAPPHRRDAVSVRRSISFPFYMYDLSPNTPSAETSLGSGDEVVGQGRIQVPEVG